MDLRTRRIPRYTVACDEIKLPSSNPERSSKINTNKTELFHPSIPKRDFRASIIPNIEKDLTTEREESETVKENIKPRRNTIFAAPERKSKKTHTTTAGSDYEILIEDCRDEVTFVPMNANIPILQNQPLVVCIRKRPLNPKELAKKELDIIMIPNSSSILVHECKLKIDMTKYIDTHRFSFDYVFDHDCINETVFNYTSKPLVQCMFSRGMATCFTYGQTGSGKTFTMVGSDGLKTTTSSLSENSQSPGIYEMTAFAIFSQLTERKLKNTRISINFFEVYLDKVFDLLNSRKALRIMEDSNNHVQVFDVKEILVKSPQQVMEVLKQGIKNRTSGRTSANSSSSRSHAIFQFNLQTSKNLKRPDWETVGKFSLVDLAGNERGADIGASNAETIKEGCEINKSLLALKECIRALWRKGSHIPFRSSKLTHILRESFMAENAKTCMIATISPGMSSFESSMDTLRYAERLRCCAPDKRPETEPNNCSPAVLSYDVNKKPDEIAENYNNYPYDEIDNSEVKRELVQIHFDYKKIQNPKIEQLIFKLNKSEISPEECINELSRIIEESMIMCKAVQENLKSVKRKLNEEEEALFRKKSKILRKY